jgi:hypothetical protein
MTDTITTELRAAMNVDREHTMGGDVVARMYCMGRDEFADLCDAIDAVHASLEAENESLRRELDRVLGEEHDFAPESHYMMLPKDADGKPIHVGDVMEWPTTGETFRVVGIGDVVLFYVEDGEERAEWTAARNKRHHVPDTWERIIMDAVCGGDEDELVARCKRLAGDAS